MNRPKAATRRAALAAAFLLFAAALFVAGPAEASRTTTDARSSLAAISAATLAPSPSLELVDSVESSPRFGFAEDLGLLDPERGSGGFVVFARELSRCALTYARNNPLKYVDPDGMEPKKPYVTFTLKNGEVRDRAGALDFIRMDGFSLARSRLESPVVFEGDSATRANFEMGLRDASGVSVFMGHSGLLGSGSLVFGDGSSSLKGVTNNNQIVGLFACLSSRFAERLGITEKTSGRAFVGTTGSPLPNTNDLAHYGSLFLAYLKRGESVGGIVKTFNAELQKDGKKYRFTLTGDGALRLELAK